jgi:hypothetical protein
MKKIFTLLVAATLATSAFAQYNTGNQKNQGYDKGRDVAVNDGRYKNDDNRYNDRYSYNKRETEMKINQINREYDYKIQGVRNNYFMNRFKKERIINMLEMQRRDEIKMVFAKSYNRRDHDDDYGSRKH